MTYRLAAFAAAATLALAPHAFADTEITVPSFSAVELRGGGHVTLRYGAAQRVTLHQGSTDVTGFHVADNGQLVIDACHDKCPREYDLEIEIVTPRLSGAAIEGGGHVETADGFPAQPAIAASVDGGGRLDLSRIAAETGSASVKGGGSIRLHADKTLAASVMGGGSVRYSGAPTVTKSILGGGSVSQDGA